MSSDVKWTVLLGLLASLLASALLAALTHASPLALLGWLIFFELLQLPMITAARRGEVDPCTAWLRRRFGGSPH